IPVASKSDLGGPVPGGCHPVSAMSGEGISELLGLIASRARALLPGEDAIALNRRQAELISHAHQALRAAGTETAVTILAESLREARASFQQVTRQGGGERLVQPLFSSFCS